MAAFLEVRGLHAYYGATEALHGIDFAVEPGGVTALLGANGAGKTTALRAICAMIRTRGEITFDGERIERRSTAAIVRRGIAHVPEGRGTFAGLTVEENLRLGAYARRQRAGLDEDYDRMFALFPVLAERRDQQAGTLSGGEQQMLAIARALMSKPRLLVLDEPSFGLAPQLVEAIFGIMRNVQAEENISMLLVEQNAALALELADQAYLLETGHVVMAGPAQALREDESVRRAYLGY
jgi:branched-chain amino acid transport system ATP-binding protein